MATIEGAFIGKVIAAAGAANRVYPLTRPQGEGLPAQVVNVIDEVEDVTHDGANGLTNLRIQLDSYGSSFKEARTAAKAAQAALNGYRGTFGGIEFQAVTKIARRDSFEGEEPDRVYRVSVDYDVWAVAP